MISRYGYYFTRVLFIRFIKLGVVAFVGIIIIINITKVEEKGRRNLRMRYIIITGHSIGNHLLRVAGQFAGITCSMKNNLLCFTHYFIYAIAADNFIQCQN